MSLVDTNWLEKNFDKGRIPYKSFFAPRIHTVGLWGVRRPMCGTPVCPWQALLSRAAVSLSSHVSETRARSGGMSGSTARLYGITVHHTHTLLVYLGKRPVDFVAR